MLYAKTYRLESMGMGIAFEVTINNETTIIAGVEEISVLSFILSYISEKKYSTERIELSVGGLLAHGKHDYEHLDWIKGCLKTGDEITIRIVEARSLTKPISRRRQDPRLVEEAQREYYESLKKEYERT